MSSGGRILVVDDERLNRMILRRALKSQGHVVDEAENGRVALARLAAGPIDLVLLDLVMPELDGYATLEAIKADPALGHLPVIIISGVEELESIVRCIEMGATDYLPKPFQPAILRARVDASLGRQAASGPRARVPRTGFAGDRSRRGARGRRWPTWAA